MLSDNVITALTDFARLPVPELRPIALGDCLRETLEFNPLPSNVKAEVDLPAALPPLMGDERQLRIVFGNLIRNARDAMAAGGTLSIGARCASPTSMVITFVDTGTGIKPEDLDRIMEPLYSTKARGLGLGLAITRSIIEKHGGRLRASSTVGVGTTFTVELPTRDAAGDAHLETETNLPKQVS
jgi:signal transduction histidine kinase